MENTLKKAAEIIKRADALLITAGAGLGVDSGLPDFRGNEGFWKAYPPIAKLKLSFSDMANPQWFKVDKEMAWAFYGHRLNLYRQTKPHQGFCDLLKMAEEMRFGYFVFTSNVDGQFQQAGYSNDKICEVHGSIHHLQCSTPCVNDVWSAKSTLVEVDQEHFKAKTPLPKCKHCGATARPNILMFGDYYWLGDRTKEQEIRLGKWLREVDDAGGKIAILELGAGSEVPTVRSFNSRVLGSYDASLIRVNPREYDVKGNNVGLALGAAEACKKITDLLGRVK